MLNPAIQNPNDSKPKYAWKLGKYAQPGPSESKSIQTQTLINPNQSKLGEEARCTLAKQSVLFGLRQSSVHAKLAYLVDKLDIDVVKMMRQN